MTKARVNADNASADIQGVTAGTGLTGGGTSGTVTLDVDTTTIQTRVANVTDTEIGYLDGVSSAIQTQLNGRIANTIVDAKGDIIAATAADTVSRLAVGANNTVLTADSAEATGLKWATPASGGMTLLASGTLSGTSVSLTSISQSYENLIVYVRDFYGSAVNDFILSVAGTTESKCAYFQSNSSSVGSLTNHLVTPNIPTTNQELHAYIFIPDYTAASRPIVQSFSSALLTGVTVSVFSSGIFPTTAAAITQIALNAPSGWGGGTYELWGQK